MDSDPIEVKLPADNGDPVEKAEIPEASKQDDDDDDADALQLTDLGTGLTAQQVEENLEKYGPNEIPVPTVPLYKLFLRQFLGFLPILIEIAAIISLGVQDYTDFGIIFGILFINAVLGFREEYHAKKALDEISDSIESEVVVRRDGQASAVPKSEIVPGDIVVLVGGTVVPADVKWVSGDTMKIDTAALTGEPLPRKYPCDEYGDVILSGTTVVGGECYGQVMATGQDTEIGQAQADILKDKSIRVVSVFQTKIQTVVQVLVSGCLAMVLAVLLVDGIKYDGFNESARDTVLNALSILIAAIPVALPLVLQVNLALGASFMAKEHNAIVTSIPALQDIASMSMLCSDKTGTLTTANMSIIPEQIYAAKGFANDDVLLYAFLCSNADKKDDPIDKAIVNAFQASTVKEKASEYKQQEIIGFNPNVKRVVAFVTHNGKTITIAKGLPAKIIDTTAGGEDDHELQWRVEQADDSAFMQEVETIDKKLGVAGYKTIAIAVCEGDARKMSSPPEWNFVGLLPMLDPPRHDTAATIASLHHANISVKIITGDHVNVGKETARLIGLGTNIFAGEEIRDASPVDKKDLIWNADGFASVLPSDKREVVLTLRREFGVVTGMTGDGVNDAPALSAAQVGIAVDGATDAAKNAADLILTEPGLSPIYGAVLESRRIFARVKAYVVYRVAASLILVLCLSIIIFVSGCAANSFLVIILALLNDISMIPVAYDKATATTKPQMPRARTLVLQAVFYGLMHTCLALLFFFVLSHQGVLGVTLEDGCPTETSGFVWFYLVLVTELMIFSVRANSFFFTSMPSPLLMLSILVTCIIGGLVAVYVEEVSTLAMGAAVIYNLGAFVVVDTLKVPFRKMINDDPGESITSDELLQVKEKNETVRNVEKEVRYQVHRESLLPPDELERTIILHDRGFMSEMFDVYPMMDESLLRRKRTVSGLGPLAAKSTGYTRKSKSISSPAAFATYSA